MTGGFWAIGNDELGARIPRGAMANCRTCGASHPVEVSKSATGGTLTLESYDCGGRTYLCGINGRLLPGESLEKKKVKKKKGIGK